MPERWAPSSGRERRIGWGRIAQQWRGGQALIEMAMLGPLLVFMVLVIVDFGRVFYEYIAVASAGRVAAEVAADNTKTVEQIQYAAEQEAGPTLAGQWSLSVNVGGSRVAGHEVWVDVSATFKPITPGISGLLGGDFTIRQKYWARSYEPGPQQ